MMYDLFKKKLKKKSRKIKNKTSYIQFLNQLKSSKAKSVVLSYSLKAAPIKKL